MPGKKPKLLIVDDEKEICNFVKLLFRRKGFLVYGATSGNQAVSTARRARPNIALIDIHLKKGIDGIEVLRQIRELVPACRCAMVTWDKAQGKMKEARRLGAVSYLTKPLTTKQLAGVVSRVVKNVKREAGANG
ncbi:MAG: response regulator [Candidatus Omnitrophota bacterium]